DWYGHLVPCSAAHRGRGAGRPDGHDCYFYFQRAGAQLQHVRPLLEHCTRSYRALLALATWLQWTCQSAPPADFRTAQPVGAAFDGQLGHAMAWIGARRLALP